MSFSAANSNDPHSEEEVEFDRFLIEEGFELLAAFRDIKDPKQRRELINLIRAAAESQLGVSRTAAGNSQK